MTPIISPWFIYLLSIVNLIKTFFILFAIIAGIGMAAGFFSWSLCATGNDEYEELESSKKLAKISTPLFILFLTLAIFIPSRNTLIGIYVTKHITTNNIKKGLEIGRVAKEEIKKDVIDLINAITNKKEINNEKTKR